MRKDLFQARVMVYGISSHKTLLDTANGNLLPYVYIPTGLLAETLSLNGVYRF